MTLYATPTFWTDCPLCGYTMETVLIYHNDPQLLQAPPAERSHLFHAFWRHWPRACPNKKYQYEQYNANNQ